MPKTKKSWSKKHHAYKKSTSWLTKYKPRASVLYRPDVGLGRSVATRLKTVIFANVTPGGFYNNVYNLLPGSAYNPLGDLSAIQPAAFDQWKALFARYLVTGAVVTVEATVQITGAGVGGTNGVLAGYPSTVVGPTASTATFQGFASQPYAQSANVIPFFKPGRIHFKLSAQQIIGRRTPVNAEDNGALVSASPTTGENMVLPIFLQPVLGAVLPVTTLMITIIQDVVFDQRIQVVDA